MITPPNIFFKINNEIVKPIREWYTYKYDYKPLSTIRISEIQVVDEEWELFDTIDKQATITENDTLSITYTLNVVFW